MMKLVAAVAVILVVVFVVRRSKAPSAAGTSAEASSDDDESTADEHALLVHIPLSDDKFGTSEEIAALQTLELELEKLIDQAGVGELDGNEMGAASTLFSSTDRTQTDCLQLSKPSFASHQQQVVAPGR